MQRQSTVMARPELWIILFCLFASLPKLTKTEKEMISSRENERPILQLNVILKNRNTPCDSMLHICSTNMCIEVEVGNLVDLDLGMQSSVTEIYKVSHDNYNCICGNKETVLVTVEEVMELPHKRSVKYRVQEFPTNDCRALVCDWILNFVPNKPGGNNDLIRCIRSNICRIVCLVRDHKLLQDRPTYSYTLLVLMVLFSIVSVLSCFTFIHWMRRGRPSPDAGSSDKDDNESESEGDEDYSLQYLPINDGFPEKDPVHLKYRRRLQRRQKQ